MSSCATTCRQTLPQGDDIHYLEYGPTPAFFAYSHSFQTHFLQQFSKYKLNCINIFLCVNVRSLNQVIGKFYVHVLSTVETEETKINKKARMAQF